MSKATDCPPVIRHVYTQLAEQLEHSIDHCSGVLSRLCQSPIEVALGTALVLLDVKRRFPTRNMLVLRVCTDDACSYMTSTFGDYRILVPQYRWGKYVIDFAYLEPSFRIFIECDGHDFHERTKEQAAHDRRKDRAIQAAGVPILRFTGMEIYADPCGCALQVYDQIQLGWERA